MEDQKSKGNEESGSKGGESKSDEQNKQKKKDSKSEANQIFKDAYERANKATVVPRKPEDLKRIIDGAKEAKKISKDEKDKERADKIGVSVEQMRKYDDIVKSLELVKYPNSNETALERLRQMFARVVSKRLKAAPHPKYPLDEGDEIIDLPGIITETRRGNFEPEVWESTEIKEKRGKKFGKKEVTLVADCSGSMNKPIIKRVEQQRATVLMMEVITEFNKFLDEEKINMEDPLEIESEIYTFQATTEDSTPRKKMGKDLSEKTRIETASFLETTSGKGTTDFICLETIEKSLTTEQETQIKEGELKKIVIVFTDGESDDKERMKIVVKKLQGKGIIVVVEYIKKAEDLPIILTKLLSEHLDV